MSAIKLERGTKIGNFQIEYRVETFSQLCLILDTKQSIFWRHRMYPTGFIRQWSFNMLSINLKYGNFYHATKIK